MRTGALALTCSPFLAPSSAQSPIQRKPNAGAIDFSPNGTCFHCSLSFSNLRRLRRYCSPALPDSAPSLDLPLLPFAPDEVLIPSECKTLHLYEARYLALLDEALIEKQKKYVHFVLDPIPSSQSSFSASYGCLVHIESIKKVNVGALVSIRGMSRVNIVKLVQMEPYLQGIVVPMLDQYAPNQSNEIDTKVSELREIIDSLHKLQIKLKVPKGELMQTRIKGSLLWAESETHDEFDQAFVPKLAERTSFAAFQPVSGMSDVELRALQREKLRAMDSIDSLERLQNGIEFVKENIKMVAARLAIQSL